MKWVLNTIFALTTSIVYSTLSSSFVSAASPNVIIRELQVRSSVSAYEEYVELYNQSTSTVMVEGWTLEYQTATGTTWSVRNTLHGSMQPDEHYLLATDPFLSELLAEQLSGGALSDTGGHLRVAHDGATIDLVGWGSAAHADSAAVAVPEKGKVLTRQTIATGYMDTDNNAVDFVAANPAPLHTHIMPSPTPTPAPTPSATPAPIAKKNTPTPAPNYTIAPITITELLPDPASPQTDSSDEYIELYNPTQAAVALDGYVLQAGSSFSYTQKLDGYSVGASGYLAIYSRDTSISLGNNGSSVRLLDPFGAELARVDYPKVVAGSAYALIAGTWSWSDAQSPGQANPVSVTDVKGATTANPSSQTSTATASKSTPSSTKSSSKTFEQTAVNRPVQTLVLVGVGALAVLYVIYEYRYDIRNKLHHLREYKLARRIHWPKLTWWRSRRADK